MHECAICRHTGEPPRATNNVVGLTTRIPELLAAALDRIGADDGSGWHVMLPACSQHVVEIYRERLNGIRMAWRIDPAQSLPAH